MLKDLGVTVEPEVAVDAKATMHVMHRHGIGKMKHLDVQYLWIQDEIRSGRLKVTKVHTSANPADLGAKLLSREAVQRHAAALGFF